MCLCINQDTSSAAEQSPRCFFICCGRTTFLVRLPKMPDRAAGLFRIKN